MISFNIKEVEDIDNIISFDLFGDGYDNPEQEFSLDSDDIGGEWKKINRIISSGNTPDDTFFRIFTNSSGSIKIEDLVIYEIVKNTDT